MKKKDIFYYITFAILFISVIGLLMAESDGYLGGTLISRIIRASILPFACSWALMLVLGVILKKIGVEVGLKFVLFSLLIFFAIFIVVL